MPERSFDYQIIEYQPFQWIDRTDHAVIGILENAEAILAMYETRRDQAREEILRRAREREIDRFEDADYICDILTPESVFVEYKPGRFPFNANGRPNIKERES